MLPAKRAAATLGEVLCELLILACLFEALIWLAGGDPYLFMGAVIAAIFLLKYGYVFLRLLIGFSWWNRSRYRFRYPLVCSIGFAAYMCGAAFLLRHQLMSFAWDWIIPFIVLGTLAVAFCALCGNGILARRNFKASADPETATSDVS